MTKLEIPAHATPLRYVAASSIIRKLDMDILLFGSPREIGAIADEVKRERRERHDAKLACQE